MSPGKLADMLAGAAKARKSGHHTSLKNSSVSGGKKPTGLFARLAALYAAMEDAYRVCAAQAGLSCEGCGDNCCTSFFQHHTYVEWAYLWRGLQALPEKRRAVFIKRAEAYVADARQSLARNALPSSMCPLNEDGLCALYAHRLMICRLHGTKNVFTLPDGRQQVFPGCHRFAALPCAQESDGAPHPCPSLDRTPFYQELASLEMELLRKAGTPLPRVNLTLGEMIVLGPPKIR